MNQTNRFNTVKQIGFKEWDKLYGDSYNLIINENGIWVDEKTMKTLKQLYKIQAKKDKQLINKYINGKH